MSDAQQPRSGGGLGSHAAPERRRGLYFSARPSGRLENVTTIARDELLSSGIGRLDLGLTGGGVAHEARTDQRLLNLIARTLVIQDVA